ncbi:hypothetical protein KEM56_000414 [Ascosphaera pollenicola]|nr:hypothetical protein KEM56_000414 [Ascosphaera pollenicola]
MPEKARLLVDKGVAYLNGIRRHGQYAASAQASRKKQQRYAALQKQGNIHAETEKKEALSDSKAEEVADESLSSPFTANTSKNDLMDLAVGGCFGTGVKKGPLIDGEEESNHDGNGKAIRVYKFGWAGM